jgi:hypothetical protein
MMIPLRLRTIRNTGIPGRQHTTQRKPDELAKNSIICILIMLSGFLLVSTNAESDDGQIDSSSGRTNKYLLAI